MTDLKSKYANILLRPRVTEKATFISKKGVYAFEVTPLSTKDSVKRAIKAYFDVVPLKVRMVKNPTKKVIVRGKSGIKPGVKKAYVYLKPGDKIE